MSDLGNHRLLSRKEAAEFLGIKEITLAIWKSTRRYNIPTVKVGRLVRYKFGDLLNFIEAQTVNSSIGEEKKWTNDRRSTGPL